MSELKCCKLCMSFQSCDRKDDCCPECRYFDVVDVICLAPEVLKKKKAKPEATPSSQDDLGMPSDVDPETFLFEDDEEDFEEDEFDLLEESDELIFDDEDW